MSALGIGYYTAVDLARRNARVILACRNTETATAAAAQMRVATGNENIVVQELDLSQLKSVRQFASIILEQETRLDILVNNAGTAGYIQCSLQTCIHQFKLKSTEILSSYPRLSTVYLELFYLVA